MDPWTIFTIIVWILNLLVVWLWFVEDSRRPAPMLNIFFCVVLPILLLIP